MRVSVRLEHKSAGRTVECQNFGGPSYLFPSRNREVGYTILKVSTSMHLYTSLQDFYIKHWEEKKKKEKKTHHPP